MTANNNTESATERHHIDPVFKEVITKDFGRYKLPIQTQVEVSRLPRSIDAMTILFQPHDIEKARRETAFGYLRTYNIVEFKGEGDLLTISAYHLIRGRSHLYLGDNRVSAREMTVTIVSAKRPTGVLENHPDDVRWQEVDTGHYISTDFPPVHLFVCDELELEPKNYLLLLFAASKEKQRQFFEQIVAEDNDFYIHYAHFVDFTLIKEVLEMAGKEDKYQETLRLMARDYGEIILSGLPPEERIHGLEPEERLRGLEPEDLVRVLTPEHVQQLSPETRERLRQLINGQGKQG